MSYSPLTEHGAPQISHDDAILPTSYDAGAQRKSMEDVNIREVITGSSTPGSHSFRWSNEQSTDAPSSGEKARPLSNSSVKSKSSSTLFNAETWTLEIISLITATAALAGIIGTLGHFNGRALPDWPFDITLSALIALLATIANANLAVPLQSGLSQLKWIRFKQGRAPLADMEVYDEASRGTWGALKLLVKARGGFYGSFGAVLVIVALSLGPFAQQVATYRSHMVQTSEGASIPRALNYTGYLPGPSSSNGFVPILPMKSAVYSGMFAEANDPSAALNVTCATGNCTFPAFETLGVCSKCVDMTQFMTRYCPNGAADNTDTSGCGWQLPGGGAVLNTSNDVFSMTPAFPSASGNMPFANIMRLTFLGTESRSVPDVLNPWAQQCTLSACIQTLQSSVANGRLHEKVTSTFTNGTVVNISNATTDTPVILTSPSTKANFTLALGSKLALESWFATLFRTGTASRSSVATNRTVSSSNLIVNLTVGVSSGMTFFDTDVVTAFYWNYYEMPDGVTRLTDDLAVSMTVAMRSFMGAVPQAGMALSHQSFVHVRWGFIAVPVVTVALTGMFLAAAMWRSRRSKTELWKSSALAMLYHGLDQETRQRLGGVGSLADKVRRARDVQVQLDEAGDAGSAVLRG